MDNIKKTIMEKDKTEGQDIINTIDDPELRAALERKRNEKRGRIKKGARIGPTQAEEYTRFCTLVKKSQIRKIREISLRETITLKELLGRIFQEAIDKYEEGRKNQQR